MQRRARDGARCVAGSASGPTNDTCRFYDHDCQTFENIDWTDVIVILGVLVFSLLGCGIGALIYWCMYRHHMADLAAHGRLSDSVEGSINSSSHGSDAWDHGAADRYEFAYPPRPPPRLSFARNEDETPPGARGGPYQALVMRGLPSNALGPVIGTERDVAPLPSSSQPQPIHSIAKQAQWTAYGASVSSTGSSVLASSAPS